MWLSLLDVRIHSQEKLNPMQQPSRFSMKSTDKTANKKYEIVEVNGVNMKIATPKAAAASSKKVREQYAQTLENLKYR